MITVPFHTSVEEIRDKSSKAHSDYTFYRDKSLTLQQGIHFEYFLTEQEQPET